MNSQPEHEENEHGEMHHEHGENTHEHGENNSPLFLHIRIFHDNGKFHTLVHRNPKFGCVLSNFTSFLI